MYHYSHPNLLAVAAADITVVYASAAVLPYQVNNEAMIRDSNGVPVFYRFVKSGESSATLSAGTLVTGDTDHRTTGEVLKATSPGQRIEGVIVPSSSGIAAGGYGFIVVEGPCTFTYGDSGGPCGGSKAGGRVRLARDSDGGKVEEDYGTVRINLGDFVLSATGAPVTNATAPGTSIVNAARLIDWAATQVAAITAEFTVPEDYDEGIDEASILAELAQTGSTDTVTIDVALQVSRSGSAIGTDLNPGVVTATQGAAAASTMTNSNLAVTGKSLRRGDRVTVTLTPAAHANDGVWLGGLVFRYQREGFSRLEAFTATSTDDASVNGYLHRAAA